MNYNLNDIRKDRISLRYLISEGFIKIKLKVDPSTNVNHLVVNISGIDGLNPEEKEVEMLRRDTVFLKKYSV